MPKPQHKADKGNVVHKALEMLAQKKLAEQEGRRSFSDAETETTWDTAAFSFDDAFETAYDHYARKCSYHEWLPLDYKNCRQWSLMAMEFNGGQFNPLKRDVIWPEKFFDFTIDEPWARYAYTLPDGRKVDGQLALKGSIDLVCKVDGEPDTIELVDWKTGERKCWVTGKPKDYDKLRHDPQLRLYHYALSKVYPQAENIIITIVFIRSGGPFSLPFGPEDLKATERMLRKRFEVVQDCARPRLIRHDPADKWKCDRLCTFGMNNWKNTKKTVCEHMANELVSLGIDKVTSKYGEKNAFLAYGDGGGKSDR